MSFAPGHVSLTFAVWPDDNPLKMGSTGIGIVLSKGVHCAVVNEELNSSKNRIVCKGEEIEDPVTLRALEILGFADKGLTVYIRRDLPIGFGMGISGASALATCLEVEKDIGKCISASHQAEVEFKTGLGDVMAISKSLSEKIFPAIAVRESPGYGGTVRVTPTDAKIVLCLSGLGRDTSEILNNPQWIEMINAASLGIQLNNVNLRSAIKLGRLFTEKTGLINENLSEMLDKVPIGATASIAHLGTSVVATSNDSMGLKKALSAYGEVLEF